MPVKGWKQHRALREAFDAVLLGSIGNSLVIQCWSDGWTPDLVRQVHGWAVFGVEQRNGLYREFYDRDARGMSPRTEHKDLPFLEFAARDQTFRLLDLIDTLTHSRRWPLLGALHWARVTVACPDRDDLFASRDAWTAWPWTTFDGIAALVWAAGLSQDEAASQHRAGTLEVAGLETLAGLRGYTLPAGPVLA